MIFELNELKFELTWYLNVVLLGLVAGSLSSWFSGKTSFLSCSFYHQEIDHLSCLTLRRVSSCPFLSYTLTVWFSLDFILSEKCSHLLATIELFFLPQPSLQHSGSCLKKQGACFIIVLIFSGIVPAAERSVLVLQIVNVARLFTCILSSKVLIFQNYYLNLATFCP